MTIRRDLCQDLPSEAFGPDSQSPPLIIIKPQLPVPDLLAENSVLFTKVVDGLRLTLIHPARHGQQKKAEGIEGL